MPKTTTGETVNPHGKDPRKLKPLACTKATPLPVPIWEPFQATSPRGRGVVRSFSSQLMDGVAVLTIAETGFRTDVWEVRIQFASRTVKLKTEIHGESMAKFKAAHLAKEYLLRAAYGADELCSQAIPF